MRMLLRRTVDATRRGVCASETRRNLAPAARAAAGARARRRRRAPQLLARPEEGGGRRGVSRSSSSPPRRSRSPPVGAPEPSPAPTPTATPTPTRPEVRDPHLVIALESWQGVGRERTALFDDGTLVRVVSFRGVDTLERRVVSPQEVEVIKRVCQDALVVERRDVEDPGTDGARRLERPAAPARDRERPRQDPGVSVRRPRDSSPGRRSGARSDRGPPRALREGGSVRDDVGHDGPSRGLAPEEEVGRRLVPRRPRRCARPRLRARGARRHGRRGRATSSTCSCTAETSRGSSRIPSARGPARRPCLPRGRH